MINTISDLELMFCDYVMQKHNYDDIAIITDW